jgi:hypothetical protein
MSSRLYLQYMLDTAASEKASWKHEEIILKDLIYTCILIQKGNCEDITR